ncbi:MAG TPA: DUF3857 domain-containing protein [Dongiaceae bacterium]|nr:DUF3857 domain-containing protein [Dongiaceae bacterium]
MNLNSFRRFGWSVLWLLTFLAGIPAGVSAQSARLAPPLPELAQQFPATGSATEVFRKILHIDVDDQWQETTTAYIAVRIGDNEAARDYSQISVFFSNYYETLELDFANVLTENGTTTPLAPDAVQTQTPKEDSFYQDTRQLVFSLPSVRPGSVLEFQYTRRPLRSIVQGEWFSRLTPYWWEDAASGTRVDAVRSATLQVTAPANKTLHLSANSKTAYPLERTQQQGRQTLRWEARAVPKFQLESNMPFEQGTERFVEVSTIRDWRTINLWAQGLIEPQIKTDAALQAIAQQLAAKATTVDEKVQAVYAHMQNNIRYIFAHVGHGGYQPHAAADVVKNAYGDCKDQTVMVVTLLRAMGVDAYPALVSTKSNGYFNPDVGMVGFDHMITYIADTRSSTHWLDTTGDHALFPGIGMQTEGQRALVINGKDATFTTLPIRTPAEQEAHLDLAFSHVGRNDVEVQFNMTFSGMFEQHFRGLWVYDPDHEKTFEAFAGQIFNKADVLEISARNSDNLWQPFSLHGKLLIDDAWEGAPKNSNLAVSVNQLIRLFSAVSGLEKPAQRQTPYVNYSGYRLSMHATMAAPDGQYAPMAVTAGPSVSNAFFQLKQSGRQVKNQYEVDISIEFPQRTITLAEYRDFYDKVDGLEDLAFWNVAFVQEKASTLAGTATHVSPTDAIGQQLNITRQFIDRGEFDKALEAATKAVAIAPRNGEAHYLLGMAQGYRGLYKESDHSFAEALKLGYKL